MVVCHCVARFAYEPWTVVEGPGSFFFLGGGGGGGGPESVQDFVLISGPKCIKLSERSLYCF